MSKRIQKAKQIAEERDRLNEQLHQKELRRQRERQQQQDNAVRQMRGQLDQLNKVAEQAAQKVIPSGDARDGAAAIKEVTDEMRKMFETADAAKVVKELEESKGLSE